MAIEKNSFKVTRFDSECSPRSRDTMSSDEDEVRRRNSGMESDDDDEFDDADSGAGSDDFDLLELGETGAEFCQIGNQTCSIPLELYDLAGLEDILSVDVWNECLSEEERLELAKYLPDMDQENFTLTLKELFTGCNLHFGSPIKKLFEMLKGGLCEPRVALYREGLSFFKKRQHYHLLRKHHNTMVSNLCQIRDAWSNCRGYSIEEKLRVLNIMKSQKSLMHEKMEDLEVDSSDEESGEGIWSRKNKNKDRKAAQKIGRYPFHGVGSGMEFDPRQPSVAMEQEKYGKQNPKGTLRLAGSKTSSAKVPTGHLSSVYHGLDMNPGLNGSVTALPRQNKPAGYDSGSFFRMRDQLRNGDDIEEMSYGLGVHRDRLRSNLMDKSGVMRMGKRHDLLRGDEVDTDHLMGLPLSSKGELQGYNRNANQHADMKMFTAKPSSKRGSFDIPRKPQYPETVQQFVGSDQVRSRLRASQMPLKGNLVESSDYNELLYNSKMPGDEYGMDSTFKYDEWNRRGKKWRTGRDSPDLGYNAYRSSSPQVSDRFLSSDFRATSLQEKVRGSFIQNGSKATEALRGNQMFLRGEETESDSSEQLNDDDDDSPLMLSKFAYLMGSADGSRKKLMKSHLDPTTAKFVRTDVKASALTQSKKKGGFADQGDMHGVENYLSKAKQKGKIRNGGPLHNVAGKVMEERYPSASDMLSDGDDDWRQVIGKNGRMRGEPAEMLDMPLSNAFAAERKKKGKIGLDNSALRPKYLHDYVGNEDGSLEKQLLLDDNGGGHSKFKRKGQKYVAYKGDQNDRSEAPLLGCSSAMKKRKLKDEAADLGGRDEDANLLSNLLFQNDSTSLKRKSKKKPEVEMVTPDIEKSELPVADMGTADIELETKPPKKQFVLITPTVHTGFSFSIMHLLTAVRMAMTSPLTEGSLEVGKPSEEQNKTQEGSVNAIPSNDKVADNGEAADQRNNTPSLNVQEIVNRVRSNPGDPCILETPEPLQDLVRGVLKIFSSKTAPLGAKGWKALTVYEKSNRSWSWVGPVLHNSSDHDAIEEVTSPEAWGLPHKMLVKLVDSFANWLKCGQETLQQIGSLPEPPLALMQVNLDEKERFRDLRAQKSLNTISPSSEEVRAYFRKEEVLRYSIPDRAFSYTAADGKKSIVAPLRRCGGKPTSKARDHFMLKRDRPPHVTILCLVRDAAARLPGNIGTRADVCTLIRDSQYIVEDVSDAQINQVVSGALDRLHYERDPCVQFDGERKLWVYLHRDREEEDFEDDGTSSTKKWKRQKKDAADQSDQGAAAVEQGAAAIEQGAATVDQGTATVALPGIGEQSGIDLCSDLNVYPPGIDEDKGMELLSNDARLNAEDLVDVNHAEDLVEVNHASEGINLASEDANVCDGDSMAWEATLGLNPPHELCQENSTNADFDDESFARERPVGLQSASLL